MAIKNIHEQPSLTERLFKCCKKSLNTDKKSGKRGSKSKRRRKQKQRKREEEQSVFIKTD